MTRFGLLRHGKTTWNAQKRIQGQTDIPLADEGIAQVRAWAKALSTHGFTRILTSNLIRARQTAEIINEDLCLPLDIEPRLCEQDWGEWSGFVIKELRRSRVGVVERQEERCWDFTPPGGEVRHAVLKRASHALVDAAQRHPDDSFLVITHQGVRMALAFDLSNLSPTPTAKNPARGYGLMRLRFENDSLHLDSVQEAF